MKYSNKTRTYEDQQAEHKNYIIQPCSQCNVNHDYSFAGRTIQCICGALLRESPDKRHKLIRVG